MDIPVIVKKSSGTGTKTPQFRDVVVFVVEGDNVDGDKDSLLNTERLSGTLIGFKFGANA